MTIPPQLKRICVETEDREQASRLEELFGVCAHAIESLSELDFSQYESIASLYETDLSLWNEIAPYVGQTIRDVKSVIAHVQSSFPDTSAPDDADFDSMFDAPETTTQSTEGTVPVGLMHGICTSLEHELARFGTGVRTPALMADHWNLLDYLGQFRGKFRTAVGEMVYAVASSFQELAKEDVIPFYREDVEEALKLRSALSTLRYDLKTLLGAEEDEESELHVLKQVILQFKQGAAYESLRASDKRSFLETFAAVEELEQKFDQTSLQNAVEGFSKFLDSLLIINRRETLQSHDAQLVQEMMTLVTERSESDADGCWHALAERLPRLHGRNEDLDRMIVGLSRTDDSPAARIAELAALVQAL